MNNAEQTRVAKVIDIDGRHPQRAVRKQVKVHVAKARKIGDRERKDLDVRFVPKVVMAEPKIVNVKLVIHEEERYVARVRCARSR